MIGKVHILNKKTSKIVKTVDYEELFHDDNLKINIRDNYLNKDSLLMVCGCNKKIELGIDTLNRIYHKKNEDISKHNNYCFKNPNFKKNSSLTGWKESENSLNVTANINLRNLNNLSTNIDDSIDIDTFTSLLNIYTWNNYIYKNHSLPKDKFEYLNKIYGMSNFIKVKNFDGITLNKLFFNISKYKEVKNNEARFVYMYIKKFEILKDKNIVNITCEYANDKTFSFSTDRKMFTDKYMSLKKSGEINGPLAISGFVTKNKSNFKFKEFSIFRINYKGVFCKDNHEVTLFNMFCKNKIAFIKPYKPIMIYNAHKPTAILIGKSKKDIFVEIFSSNSEQEIENRDKIIAFAKSKLKNSHDLIIWDAYRGANLPSLSYIRKIMNLK